MRMKKLHSHGKFKKPIRQITAIVIRSGHCDKIRSYYLAYPSQHRQVATQTHDSLLTHSWTVETVQRKMEVDEDPLSSIKGMSWVDAARHMRLDDDPLSGGKPIPVFLFLAVPSFRREWPVDDPGCPAAGDGRL